jgi:hypothetical protein
MILPKAWKLTRLGLKITKFRCILWISDMLDPVIFRNIEELYTRKGRTLSSASLTDRNPTPTTNTTATDSL